MEGESGDDISEVSFKLGYDKSGSVVSQQAGRGKIIPFVSGNPPGVKCSSKDDNIFSAQRGKHSQILSPETNSIRIIHRGII